MNRSLDMVNSLKRKVNYQTSSLGYEEYEIILLLFVCQTQLLRILLENCLTRNIEYVFYDYILFSIISVSLKGRAP